MWPGLWEGHGHERPGVEQGREEKQWVDEGLEFLGGQKGQVGRLGQLLGEYEEEREAERMREVRRENMALREIAREQEEETEEQEDEDGIGHGEQSVAEEQESPDQMRVMFERVVQEKFIYGLLDVR